MQITFTLTTVLCLCASAIAIPFPISISKASSISIRQDLPVAGLDSNIRLPSVGGGIFTPIASPPTHPSWWAWGGKHFPREAEPEPRRLNPNKVHWSGRKHPRSIEYFKKREAFDTTSWWDWKGGRGSAFGVEKRGEFNEPGWWAWWGRGNAKST